MWPVQSEESVVDSAAVLTEFGPVKAAAEEATSRSLNAYAKAEEAIATTVSSHLIDDLVAPVFVAHRGGALLYPEHSLEAYRAAAEAGFVIENDLQRLADGTIVCLHDSTVNRTMAGVSGAVSSLTLEQWLGATIKPMVPGGNHARTFTWAQFLDEMGGKYPIVAEVKDSSIAAAAIDVVAERGLKRSVSLHSFNYAVAQQVAAAGIPAGYVFDSLPAASASEIAATGIEWVCAKWQLCTPANVAAWRSAGLKVLAWTVNSRASWETLRADGVDGCFSDDPFLVSGRTGRLTGDPFATRAGYGGMREGKRASDAALPAKSFSFLGAGQGEIMGQKISEDGGTTFRALTRSLTQSWAGTVNGSFEITVQLRFTEVANSQTRWAGLYFGRGPGGAATGDDAVWRDGDALSGMDGYQVALRRNGQLIAWRADDGVGTELGNQTPSGSEVPAGSGGVRTLNVRVTPTSITARCLETGAAVTSSDSTHRGDMFVALCYNGAKVAFSRVTIGDLS